jgi:nucleoside-diphosphate-sugar epimerase
VSMARVLITGATGFVGRRLMQDLVATGYDVIAALRAPAMLPRGVAPLIVGNLSQMPDWEPILESVDAVVHTAAIAHTDGVTKEAYNLINHLATVHLAKCAANSGVARFIFLSSIRAQSGPVADHLLIEADTPAPTDFYGLSKLSAERGLAQISDMDWVALRPVLVYGAGVKGNMASLMNIARWPIPLPFASLQGKRSILSLSNLSLGVQTVLAHPTPLRRALIVADPEPLSLPEIITALRHGRGYAPLLFPFKEEWMQKASAFVGRREMFSRLAGNLMADSAALMALGWEPDTDTPAQLSDLMRRIYRVS